MKEEKNNLLTDRFEESLIFSVRKHANQFRKQTNIPYVSHLLATCGLVMEHGGTETEVIAALLHDAAEDQGGVAVLMDIRRRFGDEVADIVMTCSDDMPDDGAEKDEWTVRKKRHIEHLKKSSRSVLLVTMADKIHNLRTILTDLHVLNVEAMWKRFNATPKESSWYYRSLQEICAARNDLPKLMFLELTELVNLLRAKIAALGPES